MDDMTKPPGAAGASAARKSFPERSGSNLRTSGQPRKAPSKRELMESVYPIQVEMVFDHDADPAKRTLRDAFLIDAGDCKPAPTGAHVNNHAKVWLRSVGYDAVMADAAKQTDIGDVHQDVHEDDGSGGDTTKPSGSPTPAKPLKPSKPKKARADQKLGDDPHAARERGKRRDDHAQDDDAPEIEQELQRPPRTQKPLEARTDLGNARRLVRLFGENIRYVPPWKKWLVWDDNGWVDDDTGKVMRLAKRTIESLHKDALLTSNEEEKGALRAHAMACQSSIRLNAMIELARTELEVVLMPEKFDADPMMLGVKNGVVDLRTGAFRPARRDDYISRRCNVDFDAAAKCPAWEGFLSEVTDGDAEYTAFLARVVGYILTGKVNEEVMFVAWGDGSNGKSTFRETIFAMMGTYAVNSDSGLLISQRDPSAASPDVAKLCGRRLVTINETQDDDRLNEARMKFVTGNDTITARVLHCNPFDFMPTHKGILTTNHLPNVAGTDDGVWRRLCKLTFTAKFRKEDAGTDIDFREHRLMPELSGILNWAIAGCLEWQKQRLNPPKVVREASADYRKSMDTTARWRAGRCEKDPKAVSPSASLYDDYMAWAADEGVKSVSSTKFGRALSEAGFTKDRANNARVTLGLRLKNH